jgi:hypothetical protein
MSFANFESWKDSGGKTVFTRDDHNKVLQSRSHGLGTAGRGRVGAAQESLCNLFKF